MTNRKTINEISFLGGHSALDFVNTVDSRGERWGPELLNSYGDLVAWARRVDLIDTNDAAALLSQAAKSPTKARGELERAKDLREAMYRIFRSEADAAPVGEADLCLLNEIVHRAQSQRRLVDQAGAIQWQQAPADKLETISLRISWLAAELLTATQVRRPVRVCEGQNCGWLFLDQSRNGHRRWCSDKTCGSHARVRKFRAERTVSSRDPSPRRTVKEPR